MVAASWGQVADAAGGPFPSGATLRRGDTAWIHSEDPARLMGAALAWAGSVGVSELHLVVESESGMLARRAGALARPPGVWRLEGRELVPAEPEPLTPEASAPPLPDELAGVVGDLLAEEADLHVVAEHGVLGLELLGLEVARVEPGPEGAPVLSIGVGRHDREARRMVHAGRPGGPPDPALELRGAVEQVRRRRTAGAPAHPANQLAVERWLRAVVVGRPGLVGAAELTPVSPPLPRPNLRARSVAPAAGSDADGAPVLVVCSTGVDPELVPAASDARRAAAGLVGARPVGGGPGDGVLGEGVPGEGVPARLVLVVPERDDHPVTRRLAGLLAEPAEIRTVPADWRSRAAP